MTSIEYGTVPQQAVDWMVSEGYLRSDDCIMVVGDSDGRFAGPVSHAARVQVCMDVCRDSLERVRAATVGGCRTELFERDWRTYVPSRGGYDSVLLCSSSLCRDPDSLRRIGSVSKRSRAFINPVMNGYRGIRDSLAHVEDGIVTHRPDPSVPTDFVLGLRKTGIEPCTKTFRERIRPSVDELDARLLEDCGHTVSGLSGPVRGLFEEKSREYVYAVEVVAWDAAEGGV